MSKKSIENPKVFISYAWGTKEHENKVLAFATSLRGDGIDVILDKWNMEPGHDTYAFMEKCVNDDSVTHVLILLDPVYAKKANNRAGGVGTETQIISAKVYQQVEQSKFIPIVFERDEDGNICKPTYLESRFHIDLSKSDEYDNQYQVLVRQLYGVEAYVMPKLGTKPSWVNAVSSLSAKSLTKLDELKNEPNSRIRSEKFQELLEKVREGWFAHIRESNKSTFSHEEYIKLYESLQIYRDEYLNIIRHCSLIDGSADIISSFLEETHRLINDNLPLEETNSTFLHEMFIYTIAVFWKKKNYKDIGNILTRTYFGRSYSGTANPQNFHLFYSASNHTNLDTAVCKQDNKNYISGTAKHWITHLNIDICSKEEFVLADLICYNCSTFGNVISDHWRWFPITYIYGNEFNGPLKDIALRLCSRERITMFLEMFGYDSVEEFVKKIEQVENDLKDHLIEGYRYQSAFEYAPLLCYYIKHDEIGKYR